MHYRVFYTLMFVIGFIQTVPSRADRYTNVPGHTYTGDTNTCTPTNDSGGFSCIATGQYNNPTPVTTIIFQGNVTYDFVQLGLLVPPSVRQSAFSSLIGGGVLTVEKDMTVSGFGDPAHVLPLPQSVLSYSGGSLAIGQNTTDWYYATHTINGNLSLDGGVLVDTFAPANRGNGIAISPELQLLSHDKAGKFQIIGTTKMHVLPDRVMFYNNGKAANIAPISIDDTHVVFTGAVDFDLPVLTETDVEGNQSGYGAIVGTGTRANVSFNGGGNYKLAQKYQSAVGGVPYPQPGTTTGSDPISPRRTAVYGWVTLMGQSNLAGTRNGIPAYTPVGGGLMY